MQNTSSKTIITIVAVLVGLALIISGIVWYRSAGSSAGENNAAATALSGQTDANGVACTMDAKICPDGSSVGRVGPNCEFAACPGPKNPSQPLIPDYVKG